MSSQHSTDSRDGQGASRGANLNTKERTWILGLLFAARTRLNSPLDGPVNDRLIETMTAIMNEGSFSLMRPDSLTSVPSPKTIRLIWSQFIAVGHIGKIKKTTPRKATPDLINKVREAMGRGAKSTCEIQRLVPEASLTTIHRVMKKGMKLYFYRRRRVQKLTEEDYGRRLKFCEIAHDGLREGWFDPNKWVVGDEIFLGTQQGWNRQNDGTWHFKGSQDRDSQLVEVAGFVANLHIIVFLHAELGVIGPYNVADIRDPRLLPTEKDKKPNSLNQ